MESTGLGWIKWFLARVIAVPAILAPYRLRVGYIQVLSFLIHLPFKLFGRLARYLLDRLEIEPITEDAPKAHTEEKPAPVFDLQEREVVVIYSGGTDSTCAAALVASRSKRVHFITYSELATENSPIPTRNRQLLKEKFPETEFVDVVLSIDSLVRHFSYFDYLKSLREFGVLVLSTCGYSSLSWHVRTIVYCLENDVKCVADGLTRELMHFPGHMDEVVELHRALYEAYGIRYINPVRDWSVPPDQQFIDRVLVNRHENDFFLGDQAQAERKTTGQYLFNLGLFPHGNVKGSSLDFQMQHDCYPFALYNIVAFWGFMSVEPYAMFCQRIASLQKNRIDEARRMIDDYLARRQNSLLAKYLGESKS